jgi:GNAT superfamily N-acetyltransferase
VSVVDPRVRKATVGDVPELLRLRCLMLASMGQSPDEGGWQEQCRTDLRDRVRGVGPWSPDLWGGREATVAYVVDAADGLTASGIGWLQRQLPGPSNQQGLVGYIASMSTDPAHERKGHGTVILAALLAWFDNQGIGRVDLRATDAGRPLYEAAGFAQSGSHLERIRR